MFKIIILVFEMDINCILMKYYLVYDHNSSTSNGHYLHFNEILFNVYDRNSCISKLFYLHFNEILCLCLRS